MFHLILILTNLWVCLSNHIMCSGSMIEFTRLTYYIDIFRPLSNTKANYLVKKKSFLGILHNPIQSLLEILTCHCAARQYRPFMRLNFVEFKTLSAQTG